MLVSAGVARKAACSSSGEKTSCWSCGCQVTSRGKVWVEAGGTRAQPQLMRRFLTGSKKSLLAYLPADA
jgi:hypothetical protein